MKSIIMSCLPDDIIESVISCVSAKETWSDLVYIFEGPSDTKENRIMDLKLEYQTFRAKSTQSLSQTYTRYKTLLSEVDNDGVNLSKYEINVGFVNSLLEKWLTFSQGPRNANHTRTLDLADIYERFIYEDNLIQRRERIPDISYFYVFGCPMFIHNHKDHLSKFDAKADDGYFLGYYSVSMDFRVFNTRRQQIEKTYHVTFDESTKAIRFTNTSVDEIGIDDSYRYPPDECQEDDPSRQYQVDSNVSYYIIPHRRLLTDIT
uniref:Retrovirus-related Pol polyprotein from transposon TNT 1-94 n=1 Tax=Tanacetum cinerariifolium TaxID=118510 RepID=A0A699HJW2_TANCI|nr:retrovirus-related Pol polyprotein from transposon TNT 1-94 [Tanacetum cinerariifolium]